MNNDSLSEKEKIEWATATAFIEFYNKKMGKSFQVLEHLVPPDPDFLCIDSHHNDLKLEITLTQDRPGDIPALLGRSKQLSIEKLREENKLIREGKAHPLQFVSCFSGNVLSMLIQRIKEKFKKDYGTNTALVVRDTSRLEWDWNMEINNIRNRLDIAKNPFNNGIWIISCNRYNEYNIYRVI